MGFNFSAFVGGAAKGLADVVTEQRKDFDSRTDKYLDFSISRGLDVMDERKKERKDLMFLGRNLKQRGLSDDQVSLVLDTGLADGQAFLKSVQDKESKTGKSVDINALVGVTGDKPTGMAWEDYLDKAIMGTYATGDPYKSMPVVKDTSILGGMFSGGDEARKQAIHSRANLAGGSTGQDVGNILAASNNEVQYDRDVVAQGFVRMAGDVVAISNLQSAVVSRENTTANTASLRQATSQGSTEFEWKQKDEAIADLGRKAKSIGLKYQLRDSGKDLKAQLDYNLQILAANARDAGSPTSYQEQQIFIANAISKESNSLDPNIGEIARLESELLSSQTNAAIYFGAQRSDDAIKGVTHSTLRQLYNDLVVKEIEITYPAGKDSIFKRTINADGSRQLKLNDKATDDHIAVFENAKLTAYNSWNALMSKQGIDTMAYQLLKGALDPVDRQDELVGETPSVPKNETREEKMARLQSEMDELIAQEAADADSENDSTGFQQSTSAVVTPNAATAAPATAATAAVVVKEEVKPEEVTKVVPIDLTPVELGKAYNAGELKPDIYYTTTNRNGTTSTRLGSEIMSDLAKITGTKVKPKLTAQDKRGFLGEGIEDTVVPAITKVGKAAVNKISGLFNIDPITSAAESKLAPYVYKKPIEEAAFNSGNRTAKSSIIRNSTKAKIDIFQEGRAKEAANLLAVLLKFDVTDLRDDTQDKHEANIADLRAFIAKSKK